MIRAHLFLGYHSIYVLWDTQCPIKCACLEYQPSENHFDIRGCKKIYPPEGLRYDDNKTNYEQDYSHSY